MENQSDIKKHIKCRRYIICAKMCDFLCLRIKIYELTCKRCLQGKKLNEILFELTIYQSQHLMKNLSFYSSAEAEKMLGCMHI